jgi:hypothetical protein
MINRPDSDTAVIPVELQAARGKLVTLHEALQPRVRNHNLDLHPRAQKSALVCTESAASLSAKGAITLTYLRSREQAAAIERLMGKDRVTVTGSVEMHRHPVIELRWTPQAFAIELIVSPYAWWDQQNLVGKLELEQHRSQFRRILSTFEPDYRFGFWSGVNLDEMHLTMHQLLQGRVLDEWINTFADGQDWLRVGKWFDAQDPILETHHFTAAAFDAIKSLNTLYEFILWTSNNNFHSFYEKRQRGQQRDLN